MDPATDLDHPPIGHVHGTDEESAIEFKKLELARSRTNGAAGEDKDDEAVERQLTEEDIIKVLSRRKSAVNVASPEDQAQVEALLKRLFTQGSHTAAGEQRVRHAGVVFKNLTVRGVGLGATLQPTIADPFLALPRLARSLLTKSGALSSKGPIRKLLNDFTGVIKPGEMLLVLGAPGSGCSTFLKVLANQRYGYQSVEGQVTYGDTEAEVMADLFRNEIVYNPEDDLHYATLSVRQTLSFALKAASYGKAYTGRSYVQDFLSTITRLFLIEHTLDTKVGDSFVRGVSGGEKKRVSIAEAIITKATNMCWDNSTRGLDSSTALEYVQALRSMTNLVNISTSVALYQAAESLFDLFDKVILIHQGECAYFGPIEEAAAYFETLGFERPPRWTTADFLTSVTDPHEQRIQAGWENRIPRSPEQFAKAYAESQIYRSNLRDIAEFEQRMEQEGQNNRSSKNAKPTNYPLPFHKQVAAVTKRHFQVLWGDKATVFGKWGGITFQALIFGSLFFDLPKTSDGIFTRGGILFLLPLFNIFLSLSEINSAFAARDLLQKHKSFSFFRPSALAIAQIVADVPQVLVQVLIFSIITYFMAGLARTTSQFFIFLLFLWTLTITMFSFFRAIAAWNRSLDTATAFTGLALQSLVIYTGYLIPPIKMRPWLKWIRYINPAAYAFEALLSNEFYNLRIECVGQSVVTRGPETSLPHQSCTIQGSQPGRLYVNGEDYISTSFDYSRSHLWRNFGILLAFWAFFALVTAAGMERQTPLGGGRSTTVFKRGEVPESVERALAKENQGTDEEKAGDKDDHDLRESSTLDRGVSVKGIGKNENALTFTNVNYTIPVTGGHRQLLNDIQGFVRSGKLTALMGPSGAGKTTLLNALAQRQPRGFGVVTGDFRIGGKPLPKSFQRATGFAEQQDVHEPTTTVREALRFSALLRQAENVPVKDKYDYCEKVLDLLEMRSIAGATVGTIGKGLNQEQRKRLTIGVELARKPELLMFLDEPTSGLDSAAAFNIVRFLRKLADAGQAILCTIHQPSSVLFDEFDEVLLLKPGGRTVYHGNTRLVIDYFEKHGGHKCPPRANPAEYALEIIGQSENWSQVWTSSQEHRERSREILELLNESQSVPRPSQMDENQEYATSRRTQVFSVVKRNFAAYFRNPDYLTGKFVVNVITGLFNCFSFYHVGNEVIDLQSRAFSVFLAVGTAPPLIQQLQPRLISLRQIYLSRESNSKIYSWIAYVSAVVLVELPYTLLASSVYFLCWWWGSIGRGRTMPDSVYAWLFLALFGQFYVGFGQAIAAFAPNEFIASILVPMFFIFLIAFCGVLVPAPALPPFWRSWMYPMDPLRYWIEGVLGVAVHNVPVVCAQRELTRFSAPAGESCHSYTQAFIAQAGGYVQTGADGLCEFCQYADGDEFAASSNIHYNNRWRDYGIFFAYVFFNFVLVFFFSWLYVGGAKKIRIALRQKLKSQKPTPRDKDRRNMMFGTIP